MRTAVRDAVHVVRLRVVVHVDRHAAIVVRRAVSAVRGAVVRVAAVMVVVAGMAVDVQVADADRIRPARTPAEASHARPKHHRSSRTAIASVSAVADAERADRDAEHRGRGAAVAQRRSHASAARRNRRGRSIHPTCT